MKPGLLTELGPQLPHLSRLQQGQSNFGDLVESPSTGTRDPTPLSHMNDLDRYGLAGLLEMIRSENPEVSQLVIGHDLTSLGLDLNSQE